MIALLLHYLRRSWKLGLLVCIGATGFPALFCRVFQQIHLKGGVSLVEKVMPKWLQSAFGIDPKSFYELHGFLSVGLQHPFLLVILLAVPITLVTAFLTGDIESGTLGLVLARPVGRIRIFCSAMIVATGWMTLATLSVVGGLWVGARWAVLPGAIDYHLVFRTLANLWLLEWAFAGITAFISAMGSQRGDATGWCVTIVLVMYVWNFLANVWNTSGRLMNDSLFAFYQPTRIMLHHEWPVSHLETLALVGLVGCLAGVVVYRVRDFSV